MFINITGRALPKKKSGKVKTEIAKIVKPGGEENIREMECRKCYLDVILVPLGFLISIGYHFWLWHKVRTQPHTTIIGINASGRRNWISSMLKVTFLTV